MCHRSARICSARFGLLHGTCMHAADSRTTCFLADHFNLLTFFHAAAVFGRGRSKLMMTARGIRSSLTLPYDRSFRTYVYTDFHIMPVHHAAQNFTKQHSIAAHMSADMDVVRRRPTSDIRLLHVPHACACACGASPHAD